MDYKNKTGHYYKHTRNEMLPFLPNTAKKVLDVGCGEGTFALSIKEKNNAEVWGIELMDAEAQKAKIVLDKVYSGPCEEYIDGLPDNYFDAIFFNDVLEHLVDPYKVLEKIKNKLSNNGVVISSIPNMRFHRIIKDLYFNGDFKYVEQGIMDRTHLRFFTKKSIERMYYEAGYNIITHTGINPSKSLKIYLYNIPLFFKGLDMKYHQFVTVAQKK